MKHLKNFNLFEKKVTIDFPDYLIRQFEERCEEFFEEFEDIKIKNKTAIINSWIKKFIEFVIDFQFNSDDTQGSEPLDIEKLTNYSDDIMDILSRKEFRDIILKDNKDFMPIFLDNIISDNNSDDYEKYKEYIDAKKYNL